MKYILFINDNMVKEIIPGEDPVFPGIPIEERFPPDFVSQLMPVEDNVEVYEYWVYNSSTGTFDPPPPPESEVEPGEEEEEPVFEDVWFADHDYEPGAYLTRDNNLYKVLLPVYAGTQFTIGTNIELTSIEEEFMKLNQEDN